MAPSRDFGLIGRPGSTMAWVVMPDGRIKRGDGEQGHPDDGHAAVPGLLVFEPNKTVSHWPQQFTSWVVPIPCVNNGQAEDTAREVMLETTCPE